ncbi:MAG: hypothetical protein IJ816_04320 [Alloprevotella sp.]|nr:hypothetical protein [Alloprevotella sp.]
MAKNRTQKNARQQLLQRRQELEAQLLQENYFLQRQTHSLFKKEKRTLRFSERIASTLTYALQASKIAVPLWRLRKRFKRRK